MPRPRLVIVKTDIATVIAVFTALPDCCALQYRFENDTSSVEGEPGRPLGILECNEIVTASLDGCIGQTSQVSDVECASAALWAIPCVSARTATIFCTITLQTLCRSLIVHTPKRPLDLPTRLQKKRYVSPRACYGYVFGACLAHRRPITLCTHD